MEFRKLGALGAAIWKKSLHSYFTMDDGKLEMIAAQRANETEAFIEKINAKKYGDEIDQNFNEVY